MMIGDENDIDVRPRKKCAVEEEVCGRGRSVRPRKKMLRMVENDIIQIRRRIMPRMIGRGKDDVLRR